jgi:hypothetical protein
MVGPKFQDGEAAAREILLIAQVLVANDDKSKPLDSAA